MLEKIHWLGHAAFCIEAEARTIYIDPYELRRDEPKADIILVSHDHFDHCSNKDIRMIHKPETVIIAPQTVKDSLSFSVRIIRPKERLTLGSIEIEAVFAYNINTHFHAKSENNLGFIIQFNQTRIYHAGDTDFIPEMKQIQANVALLPVGGTYTMNYRDAAEAANAINPAVVIPMHWGSVVGSRKDAEDFQKLCKCTVKIVEPER